MVVPRREPGGGSLQGLPPALRFSLLLMGGLTLLSGLDLLLGLLRHQGRMATVYLWAPGAGFDLVDYLGRYRYLHSARFFSEPVTPWYYPAPAIFVLSPFYALMLRAGRAAGFAAYVLLFVAALSFALRRMRAELQRRGLSRRSATVLLWGTAALNWPLYFAMQRGNIEALTWFVTAAAIACYVQRRPYAAAVLLGIVGSFKLYPLLFLALYLRERRVGAIATGLAVAGGLTVLALYVLDPHVLWAYRQVQAGVAAWTGVVTAHQERFMIGLDHSAFALLRQMFWKQRWFQAAPVLPWYLLGAAVVATAVFLLRVVRLPRPNQVLFLACATVLLPPASFEYTLVTLLIPWSWLALLYVEKKRDGASEASLRVLAATLGLLAIAMAPLAFVHAWSGAVVYLQGAVRALVLLMLLGLTCGVPITETPRASVDGAGASRSGPLPA